MVRPALLLAVFALAALFPSAPARGLPAATATPTRGAGDPLAERFADASAAAWRDRASPAALAALLTLEALESEHPDLSRLAALYARIEHDGATHPEVRAAALYRLTRVERALGNLVRSEARLRTLGLVSGWQVIGPFDDEGKRGLATAYPPEQGIAPADRHPGKEREVAWRPLPKDAQSGGFVHLGAALRPAREVVAYALTSVVAARDERVQLWFGGSGAAKVWVNGALVFEDPTYHEARLDQRGAAVTLRKGTNRILVKLCQQGNRMGFFLRLAGSRGEGRSFPAGDPFAPAASPGPAPTPLADAVAVLTRRAEQAKGKGAPAAHATLSAVLRTRAAGDEADRRAAAEAARAAALAPRDVDAQLAAAVLEEDRTLRRVILDRALRLAPEDPRVLRFLADEELAQGRPQAAARLVERALAAAPAWAELWTAFAEALDRSGFSARAALVAEDAAHRFPTSPSAVRAAALAANRLGRLDQAIGRERTLLALRFDDVGVRASLASHLVDRGDLDGAVGLLREGLRVAPGELALHLRLADLLAANDRMEEAEEVYARALELCPEEADGWERRGRARLSAGRAREARTDLARALQLRPQNPELKELVRSLTPDEERFWKPYQLDARALAAKAPAARPDEDAIVLAELHVTRVLPSGLSSSYTHRVVKVLTARGADAFRRQRLAWTPDRQELRVERAAVLKPDGRAVESHGESVQSASEPWYRLYYDLMTRTLSFEALQPGDVLEVAWRVDDTASENLLSDYFGDFTFLEETSRKLRFEYVLLVPEARAIHANRQAGVEHAVRSLPGGVREHRYVARDLPRITPEPGMPGWSEVSRYLHVSTFRTWDEVNHFYWRLVRDQVKPTAEIRALAQQLRATTRANGGGTVPAKAGSPPDPETRLALVRAAYGFVVSQTRYVGLEFGIHGYKPYRVDQILSRRFGDCKDKASLLHALLASMDIEARLVLLRTRRMGRVPEEPASLSVFDHAIVYVPEFDLWLDGTASYSGTRDLPSEDRGATVLVVNPDGPPRFGTIPDATAGDNRLEADLQLALAPDGSAAVRGLWRAAGQSAPDFRRTYGAEDGRRKLLEQSLGRLFPGAKVEAVAVSELQRIEDDVEIRFSASVPRAAQADGAGLRFTPFGAAQGYADSYTPLSARAHELDLGAARDTRFRYRFALPPGWRVLDLPDPVRGETALGSFELRYREEGGAVVAEGRVILSARRVAVAEYAAFRELMIQLDRAFSRRVRIAPAGENDHRGGAATEPRAPWGATAAKEAP